MVCTNAARSSLVISRPSKFFKNAFRYSLLPAPYVRASVCCSNRRTTSPAPLDTSSRSFLRFSAASSSCLSSSFKARTSSVSASMSAPSVSISALIAARRDSISSFRFIFYTSNISLSFFLARSSRSALMLPITPSAYLRALILVRSLAGMLTALTSYIFLIFVMVLLTISILFS